MTRTLLLLCTSVEQESQQGREVHARHKALPSSEEVAAFASPSVAGVSQITLTEAVPFHEATVETSCGGHMPGNSHHALLSGSSLLASLPLVCGSSTSGAPEVVCTVHVRGLQAGTRFHGNHHPNQLGFVSPVLVKSIPGD